MGKLLNYYLNWFRIITFKYLFSYVFLTGLFFIIGCIACQNEGVYFKKKFSKIEQKELAKRLESGSYYGGALANIFHLKEALSFDDSLGAIYQNLGTSYLFRGDPVAFDSLYPKASWQDKSYLGYEGYDRLYFYRDYKNAIKNFNDLDKSTPNIVDYPQSTSVHYMRAICYFQLKDYQKASEFIELHFKEEERTSGFDYIDTNSFLLKAKILIKLDQEEQALKLIDQGLKSHKNNSADLVFLKAQLMYSKDTQEALKLVDQAEQLFNNGFYHKRSFVEEFFQLYKEDFLLLRNKLLLKG